MLNRFLVMFVTVGSVVTATVVVYGLLQVWEYQRGHAEHRQNVSSYKAETDEHYSADCLKEGVTLGGVAKCLIQSVDANREAQRSNYDLQAQQEMAEWAFALLLATIVSLVIGGLGLVAILISLAQTRIAIRNAREIGEAQVRAYVKPTIRITVGDEIFDKSHKFWGGWRNCGQSPIVESTCSSDHKIVDISAKDEPIPAFVIEAKIDRSSPSAYFAVGDSHSYPICDIPGAEMSLLWERKKKLILFTAIAYRDVFGVLSWCEHCSVAEFPEEGNTIKFSAYPHHNGFKVKEKE